MALQQQCKDALWTGKRGKSRKFTKIKTHCKARLERAARFGLETPLPCVWYVAYENALQPIPPDSLRKSPKGEGTTYHIFSTLFSIYLYSYFGSCMRQGSHTRHIIKYHLWSISICNYYLDQLLHLFINTTVFLLQYKTDDAGSKTKVNFVYDELNSSNLSVFLFAITVTINTNTLQKHLGIQS